MFEVWYGRNKFELDNNAHLFIADVPNRDLAYRIADNLDAEFNVLTKVKED